MMRHCRRYLLIGMIALLTACASLQPQQSPLGTLPTSAYSVGGFDREAPRDDDCGGTHKVRVRPCPVILKNPSGIDVTVSGPGVTDSNVSENGCINICSATQISHTKWLVTPGEGTKDECGIGELTFYAYTGKYPYQFLGYGYLKVENKYCP